MAGYEGRAGIAMGEMARKEAYANQVGEAKRERTSDRLVRGLAEMCSQAQHALSRLEALEARLIGDRPQVESTNTDKLNAAYGGLFGQVDMDGGQLLTLLGKISQKLDVIENHI